MKLLIADDDTLVRDGLQVLLDLEDDIEVVGTAKDGAEAAELAAKLLPNIVLMDIRMPGVDGVTGTGLVKSCCPSAKVVILTTFQDEEYLKQALRKGAEGYLLKSMPADSMVQTLRAVVSGSVVLNREMAHALPDLLRQDDVTDLAALGLSQREQEIVCLIGEGLSNQEIARQLCIGEGTARNHVTVILSKLGLRDRTQLAIFYLKNCGR